MIIRRKIQTTVLMEWKNLNSDFNKALKQNVTRFFKEDVTKTYYVIEFEDLTVINHRINCENQMMVSVECHAIIFEPKPGILSMTVEDIDKKDNFAVFHYNLVKDFKVFVTTNPTLDLNVGDIEEIDIQILKNHKNNIIAIGSCL